MQLQKIPIIISAPILLCLLTACGQRYLTDRANDATDFFALEADGWALGAAVNAGPLVVGAYGHSGPDGYGAKSRLGLGGVHDIEPISGGMLGVGIPMLNRRSFHERRNWYDRGYAKYGSVGFNLGAIFGFGARFDIIEFGDFLGGLVGLDFIGDDNRDRRGRLLPPATNAATTTDDSADAQQPSAD